MDAIKKRCTSCGETLPRSQFHTRTLSKDGLASRCKPCRNAEMKRRYEASKGISA